MISIPLVSALALPLLWQAARAAPQVDEIVLVQSSVFAQPAVRMSTDTHRRAHWNKSADTDPAVVVEKFEVENNMTSDLMLRIVTSLIKGVIQDIHTPDGSPIDPMVRLLTDNHTLQNSVENITLEDWMGLSKNAADVLRDKKLLVAVSSARTTMEHECERAIQELVEDVQLLATSAAKLNDKSEVVELISDFFSGDTVRLDRMLQMFLAGTVSIMDVLPANVTNRARSYMNLVNITLSDLVSQTTLSAMNSRHRTPEELCGRIGPVMHPVYGLPKVTQLVANALLMLDNVKFMLPSFVSMMSDNDPDIAFKLTVLAGDVLKGGRTITKMLVNSSATYYQVVGSILSTKLQCRFGEEQERRFSSAWSSSSNFFAAAAIIAMSLLHAVA